MALLVEMHRTKDALKLLACLLSRVHGARQQHLFFGLARLYAKHGLNKDALVSKLPSLCSMPPDRRTWELLKSMSEVLHLKRLALFASASVSALPCRPALSQCTPTAVDQQLQKYIDEAGPGHFTHVPQITEVMCKLPFGAHGSAAGKAMQLLKQCAAQVQTHPRASTNATRIGHANVVRCGMLCLTPAFPHSAPHATQVTPDYPDDLRIIVDDMRAFVAANLPASVSKLFPKTIETILHDYVKALGPHHTVVRWHLLERSAAQRVAGTPLPHPCLLQTFTALRRLLVFRKRGRCQLR